MSNCFITLPKLCVKLSFQHQCRLCWRCCSSIASQLLYRRGPWVHALVWHAWTVAQRKEFVAGQGAYGKIMHANVIAATHSQSGQGQAVFACLPGTQVKASLCDGDIQRCTKHAALDMPWHVIIALICVNPRGRTTLRHGAE